MGGRDYLIICILFIQLAILFIQLAILFSFLFYLIKISPEEKEKKQENMGRRLCQNCTKMEIYKNDSGICIFQ